MKSVLGLLFGFSILLGGSLNAEAQDMEERAQKLKETYEQKRAELQKNFENSIRQLRSDFGKKMRELEERSRRGRGDRDEDGRDEDEGDQFDELMDRIERLEGMVEGLVERLRGMYERNRGERDERREDFPRRDRERDREDEGEDREKDEENDRRDGFRRGNRERGRDMNPGELRKRMEGFMERGRSFRMPEDLRELLENGDWEGLSEKMEPLLDQLEEGDLGERFERLGLDIDELREAIEEQDLERLAEQLKPLMERFEERMEREGGKWRERMEKNRKDGNRFEFRFRRDREREKEEDEDEDEEEAGIKIERDRVILVVPEKGSKKKGECPFKCPVEKGKKDGLKKRLEKILPENQDTRLPY